MACTATNGGGAGYALGVCADTGKAVFQNVAVNVAPVDSPRSYSLTLGFPAALPADLSGTTGFTEADNRIAVGDRDTVGAIRGAAYESPRLEQLTPPYTALTDFRRAWLWSTIHPDDSNTALTLQYSGFGLWERFATPSFVDGYFGPWYAAWPGATAIGTWPTAARSYSGIAIGVLTPSGDMPASVGSVGFSATVSLQVDATGRLVGGGISALKTATINADGSLNVIDVLLNPLGIAQDPGNPVNGALTGTLATSAATGTTAQGEFDASWFGTSAAPGAEIAGRFRVVTSDGLIASGSFGAN